MQNAAHLKQQLPVLPRMSMPRWAGGKRLLAVPAVVIAVLAMMYLWGPPVVDVNLSSGYVDIADTPGGARLQVTGTVRRLPDDHEILILVRELKPFALAWYVQAPATIVKGRWSASVQIGNAFVPPHSGDMFAIVAAVVPRGSIATGANLDSPRALGSLAATAPREVVIRDIH